MAKAMDGMSKSEAWAEDVEHDLVSVASARTGFDVVDWLRLFLLDTLTMLMVVGSV